MLTIVGAHLTARRAAASTEVAAEIAARASERTALASLVPPLLGSDEPELRAAGAAVLRHLTETLAGEGSDVAAAIRAATRTPEFDAARAEVAALEAAGIEALIDPLMAVIARATPTVSTAGSTDSGRRVADA